MSIRIRGEIQNGENISLHCCEYLTDIEIDNQSLYEILHEEFNLDEVECFNGKSSEDKFIGVSYLIVDGNPGDGDFEQIIGEWIVKKLYTEHSTGCYSEYTCGYGGFNYFIDGGHNIFKELSSYVGKYILLDIRDMRELIINDIIK